MFPVLTVMYVKLARTEERDSMAEFGEAYAKYAAEVPGFIPRLSRIFSEASKGSYHHGR
jgi:protein-S-isoprenylcysteine O-methyltransferase Ste14